ncbi:outer membrane immunogenic protein [Bradyrhizobium erythrophlei]|jgi:outer membrane immunogenic protein|uniref:Outer membrane immunogenic protein n=2 Tax=Bradyrhizobium erythrophlei TaxID=1437360 RepID=A0A1M7T1M0_9BRAD|nr:outer membrane immunogenic protein [Bradyrhizobium erythrophlei]
MSHQLHKTNLKNRQTSAANSCEIKMKNIILGAVSALLLGTTTGLAADLPVKAPPPVVIYDWTGFYIGVSGGGSLGGSNHVDPAGQNLTADGFNLKGGLVGGTIGYNWQVSSFVLGFEGDLSWVGEYGNHDDNNNITNNGSSLFADQTFKSFTKENWLGTARVRAGYAVNNLLFYGTGGWAGAGVDAGIKNLASNATVFSSSSTRNGWVAGAGLEWGFAPNWSTKFELLYTKFDDKGFVTALGDGTRSAVTLDDYIFRVGINYRFGGGPVVAKY